MGRWHWSCRSCTTDACTEGVFCWPVPFSGAHAAHAVQPTPDEPATPPTIAGGMTDRVRSTLERFDVGGVLEGWRGGWAGVCKQTRKRDPNGPHEQRTLLQPHRHA